MLFKTDCVTFRTDYCPEFNTGHWDLDTVPYNVTEGCPNVTFLSSEVYQCKNSVFHTLTNLSVYHDSVIYDKINNIKEVITM